MRLEEIEKLQTIYNNQEKEFQINKGDIYNQSSYYFSNFGGSQICQTQQFQRNPDKENFLLENLEQLLDEFRSYEMGLERIQKLKDNLHEQKLSNSNNHIYCSGFNIFFNKKFDELFIIDQQEESHKQENIYDFDKSKLLDQFPLSDVNNLAFQKTMKYFLSDKDKYKVSIMKNYIRFLNGNIEQFKFEIIETSYLLAQLRDQSVPSSSNLLEGFKYGALTFLELIINYEDLTGIGCDTWLKFDIIVPFVLSLIFIIFCAVYGLCLYKLINNKHLSLSGLQKKQKNNLIQDENDNNNKNNSGLDTTPFLSHKQQFYRQQEKQILFVIICFSSIWLGEFIMYILQLVLMEDKLLCDNEKTLILAADQGGEIFLFVFSVLQLLPSTIIPYIFYYLPYVNQKKGKKYDLISLGKVSFSQEEQNFNFGDNNQNQNKNIDSNEQFIQSTQVVSQNLYENEDENETHESYDNYDDINIGSNQNKQQSNQLIKKANKTTYDNLQQTEFNYNYNYDELFK
ncbi:hypothetical protein PPERSA_01458 [Pseudocohnilembus persalinus]|uniref:Transmembrane protein n=1 Tax=Pseudocohnilembus persalinus TaxID=266149 RepID=A0A0V0QGZ2_PSEPJ|nr:hypothetical protein PPERSA_01458 [Pseudocohnilembus persalinus]|eukprot:KRX01555.1 hypothetical protein PPERSA_01458 [Pseudocohnilembus persalinus]